jgi:hypothetical protein
VNAAGSSSINQIDAQPIVIVMATLINRAVVITMAVAILCRAIIQIHLSTRRQLGLLVADLFRENGCKVLPRPCEQNSAPNLIASRADKKLIIEIKRAS